MLKNGLGKCKMELAVLFAVIILLSIILMLCPITGVADNGDFARIMNSTGLSYMSDVREDRYFGYVNRLYGVSSAIPFAGGYLSTQIPLVLFSVFLSKTLSGALLFDIRFLGGIYILVLAAAAFFTVGHIRKKTGIVGLFSAVLLVLVFCDIGYTAYFNSLYGEPVTFVFLLLMAGTVMIMSGAASVSSSVTAYSAGKPAIWTLVIFCIAVLFFAGAKVQNTPAGLLAALLCIRAARLRKDAAWRRIATGMALMAAIISLACYASVSKEIKVCNKYQSVFYGILKDSPDPAGDLQELGLDPSLAVLAGTHYFLKEYPIDIRTREFKNMIFDKIGYTKVAGFYLRHPGRLRQKLETAASNGFLLKQGFGNYEKAPGIRYKQISNVFSLWSDFKMNVLPHSLPFIIAFFVLVILVLAVEYRRGKNPGIRFLIEYFGFIAVMGVMQFILPVLADGEADISKHLFLFNISFDILFAAGFTYVALKAVAAVAYLRGRWFSDKLQPG